MKRRIPTIRRNTCVGGHFWSHKSVNNWWDNLKRMNGRNMFAQEFSVHFRHTLPRLRIFNKYCVECLMTCGISHKYLFKLCHIIAHNGWSYLICALCTLRLLTSCFRSNEIFNWIDDEIACDWLLEIDRFIFDPLALICNLLIWLVKILDL